MSIGSTRQADVRATTREEYERTEAERKGRPEAGRGAPIKAGSARRPTARWDEAAACIRGVDPTGTPWRQHTVWHSPHLHIQKIVRAAVELCASCPVTEQCAAEDDGHPCIRAGVVRQPHTTFDRDCRVCGKTFVVNSMSSMSRKLCGATCRAVHEQARNATVDTNRRVLGPVFIACFPAEMSDRRISEICGVHPRRVANWRTGGAVRNDVLARIGLTPADIRAGWVWNGERAAP